MPMDGNASGAGQHAPQGQCNAQTEHRDADRMPVHGIAGGATWKRNPPEGPVRQGRPDRGHGSASGPQETGPVRRPEVPAY